MSICLLFNLFGKSWKLICNNMHSFVSMTFTIISILTILFVVPSRLSIKTFRRCVAYRVLNSRWNDTVLSLIQSAGHSECMMQCARHQNCSAINIRSGTGTCELLPNIGDCMETQAEEGSTFVRIGDCYGRAPWLVERRNWSSDDTCLTWEPHDATKSARCPRGVLRDPSGRCCAALTPHKGLYLPSWYSSRGGFRMVTESGVPQTCLGARAGYLLRVAPECPTEWHDYSTGDIVPSQAVQVSSWKDGTPIYLISTLFRGRWYLGYYLPLVQRAFITAWTAWNPRFVRILVYA